MLADQGEIMSRDQKKKEDRPEPRNVEPWRTAPMPRSYLTAKRLTYIDWSRHGFLSGKPEWKCPNSSGHSAHNRMLPSLLMRSAAKHEVRFLAEKAARPLGGRRVGEQVFSMSIQPKTDLLTLSG